MSNKNSTTSNSNQNRGSWLRCLLRLVRGVRCFGMRNGWRWWNIENACYKDPKLVLKWSIACENAAIKESDPKMKAVLLSWSADLCNQYSFYTNHGGLARRHEVARSDWLAEFPGKSRIQKKVRKITFRACNACEDLHTDKQAKG